MIRHPSDRPPHAVLFSDLDARVVPATGAPTAPPFLDHLTAVVPDESPLAMPAQSLASRLRRCRSAVEPVMRRVSWIASR